MSSNSASWNSGGLSLPPFRPNANSNIPSRVSFGPPGPTHPGGGRMTAHPSQQSYNVQPYQRSQETSPSTSYQGSQLRSSPASHPGTSAAGGVAVASLPMASPPQPQLQLQQQQFDPLQEAKRSVEDILKSQAASTAELQQKTARCTSLERENAELVKTNKALREDQARLNQVIANEKNMWQKLQVDIVEVRTRAEMAVDDTRQLVQWKDQAEKDKLNLKRVLDELGERKEVLELEKKGLERDLATVVKERDEWHQQTNDLGNKLNEIQSLRKSAEDRVAQLTAELQQVSQSLNDTYTELAEERQRLLHSQALLMDKDVALANMTSKLAESDATNEEHKRQIEVMKCGEKETLAKHQSQVDELMKGMQVLKDDLTQLQEREQQLLAQLCASAEEKEVIKAEARDAVERLKQEGAREAEKLKVSEETVAQLYVEINKERDHRAREQAETEKMSRQMEEARAELAKKCEELEHLKADNEKYRSEGEAVRSELAHVVALAENNRAEAVRKANELIEREEEMQRMRAAHEDAIKEKQRDIDTRDKQISMISKNLNEMTRQFKSLSTLAKASEAVYTRPVPPAAIVLHSTPATVTTAAAEAAETEASDTEPIPAPAAEMPPPPPKAPSKSISNTSAKQSSNPYSVSMTKKGNEFLNITYGSKKSEATKSHSDRSNKPSRGSTRTKHAPVGRRTSGNASDDDIFGFK